VRLVDDDLWRFAAGERWTGPVVAAVDLWDVGVACAAPRAVPPVLERGLPIGLPVVGAASVHGGRGRACQTALGA
jgi:hypothetical protein